MAGVKAKWKAQFKKPGAKGKWANLRTGAGKGFLASLPMRARPGELKVIDTANAAYVCDTTGTVTLLNGVATGTDLTDRIGRKIFMRAVQVRGLVQPVDNTIGQTLARVMVVYDKQPTGGTPAITDILTASRSEAFNNLNNRDRFVVVFDAKFPIGGISDVATQAVSSSPNTHVLDEYRRLNHEVIFSGTGATAASISSGALWLITIGNQAAGAGGSFVGNVRVRFNDQ